MYAHTNPRMNTWTHTFQPSYGIVRWNGGCFMLAPLSCDMKLSHLSDSQGVNIRSKWGKGQKARERTLHRSVTHSHALVGLLTGRHVFAGNLRKHKCWDNATMQVRNKYIQSRSFTGRLGWYYYGCYGDRWSYGLTYFSFSEDLLWPASALNCALFPVCKGKPNMKEIKRCSRKKWERKREKQTTNGSHSVRVVGDFTLESAPNVPAFKAKKRLLWGSPPCVLTPKSYSHSSFHEWW